MDLTRVPVRLGVDAERVWRGHVERWFEGVDISATMIEGFVGDDERRAKRRRSIQQDWSRFLRGDGEAVLRWLDNHGATLEAESGVARAVMEAEYLAIVSPRPPEARLPEMAPRWSGEALGAEGPTSGAVGMATEGVPAAGPAPGLVASPSALLAAAPSAGPAVALHAALKQWFGEGCRGEPGRRPRVSLRIDAWVSQRALVPAGACAVRWSFAGGRADPSTSAALRSALAEAGFGHDRVEGAEDDRPAPLASPDDACASGVAWAPPRDPGWHGDRPNELKITLSIEPFAPEDVAAWVDAMGSRVDVGARARVEARLLAPWRTGALVLPDALRTRQALEALTLDVADGNLPEVSAVACQRAWTSRRRREVAERVVSADARLMWEREAARFGRAWLLRAGSTGTALPIDEVKAMLTVKSPQPPSPEDVARWAGLLGGVAPLDRLREALAPWARTHELVRALIDAGALHEAEGRVVPADPDLWRDLAAEALLPADIAALSPFPDAHEAIVLAVGLNGDPDAFLRAALAEAAPLRGVLCETVLRGVAWRGGGGDDALVERTWAVAVWDTLHAPGEEVPPSAGSVAARYAGRLAEVSEALRARLPRLADADPHADLQSRVPSAIVEATRAWRGLPSEEDELKPSLTEIFIPDVRRRRSRARRSTLRVWIGESAVSGAGTGRPRSGGRALGPAVAVSGPPGATRRDGASGERAGSLSARGVAPGSGGASSGLAAPSAASPAEVPSAEQGAGARRRPFAWLDGGRRLSPDCVARRPQRKPVVSEREMDEEKTTLTGAHGRERATRSGAVAALVHLCPWQISPLARPWSWGQVSRDVGARVLFDRARGGDRAARRALLIPRFGGWLSVGVWRRSDTVGPWERLRWAAEAELNVDAVTHMLRLGAASLRRELAFDESKGREGPAYDPDGHTGAPDAAVDPPSDPLLGAGEAWAVLLARLPGAERRWWLFWLGDYVDWSDDEVDLLSERFGGRPPFWGRSEHVEPRAAVALAERAREVEVLRAWLNAPARAVARLRRVRDGEPLRPRPSGRGIGLVIAQDVDGLTADAGGNGDSAAVGARERAEAGLRAAWTLRHHALLALDRLGEAEPIRLGTLSAAGMIVDLGAARAEAWRGALEAVLGAGRVDERSQPCDANDDERRVSAEAWTALAPAVEAWLTQVFGETRRSDADATAAGVRAAGGSPRLRVLLVAACAQQLWDERGRNADGLDALVPWADAPRASWVFEEPSELVEDRLRRLLEREDPVAVAAAEAMWRRWPEHARGAVERLASVVEGWSVVDPRHVAAWSSPSSPVEEGTVVGSDHGAPAPRIPRAPADPPWPWGDAAGAAWTGKPPPATLIARLRDAKGWCAEALGLLPHPALKRWVMVARTGTHGRDGQTADVGARAVVQALRGRLSATEEEAALIRFPGLFVASWEPVARRLPSWRQLEVAEKAGDREGTARAWERRRAEVPTAEGRLVLQFPPSRPWTVHDASDTMRVLGVDPPAFEEDDGQHPTVISAVEAVLTARRARGPLAGLPDAALDGWLVRHVGALAAWRAAPHRWWSPIATRLDELAAAGVTGLALWTGSYEVQRARDVRWLQGAEDALLVHAALGGLAAEWRAARPVAARGGGARRASGSDAGRAGTDRGGAGGSVLATPTVGLVSDGVSMGDPSGDLDAARADLTVRPWDARSELQRRYPRGGLASLFERGLTRPGAWVPGRPGGEDDARATWVELLLHDPGGACVLLDGFTKRYPKQRAGIGAWVLGALGGWPGRDLGTAALRRAALEWVRSPGAGSSR